MSFTLPSNKYCVFLKGLNYASQQGCRIIKAKRIQSNRLLSSVAATVVKDKIQEAYVKEVMNSHKAAIAVSMTANPVGLLKSAQDYINAMFNSANSNFKETYDKLISEVGVMDSIRIVAALTQYRAKRIIRDPELRMKTAIKYSDKHVDKKMGVLPANESDLRQLKEYLNFAQMSYDMEVTSTVSSEPLRNSLKEVKHELIAHNPYSAVHAPGYFVSFTPKSGSNKNGTIVVTIKGTSNISDWFTNLTISPSMLFDDDHGVHGGTLEAARFVMHRLTPFLKHFVVNNKDKYDVVFVGHSLGAGVAILCSLLTVEEYKLLSRDRVKCIAYAPPPVLSPALSEKVNDMVLSVVHGDDIIPRMSAKNINTLFTMIRILKSLETTQGSWQKVEEEVLDKREWVELEEEALGMYDQAVYDTVVPGKILYLIPHGGHPQQVAEPTIQVTVTRDIQPPKDPAKEGKMIKFLADIPKIEVPQPVANIIKSLPQSLPWQLNPAIKIPGVSDKIVKLDETGANYTAVQVGPMFPALRTPMISTSPVEDHLLHKYKQALDLSKF